jgi:uncharacterized RDD family membrane protein YckC
MTTGLGTTGRNLAAGLYPAETRQSLVNTQSSGDAATEGGLNFDSWRVEVSARLERYRTRRKPRTPRYPSLLLPFDAPESWSRPAPPSGSAAVSVAQARPEHAFAFDMDATQSTSAVEPAGFAEPRPMPARQPSRDPQLDGEQFPEQPPEVSAKVIEFPRSAAIPVFRACELADPIFDRPRIVEAPEILPPPPALGGMLMEPAQPELADRRAADFTALAGSASRGRRALASLVDAAIMAAALTAVAAIFLRLNPNLNPVRGPLAIALGVAALVLWVVYEFLFVVYTGSTPGLRTAKLRLVRFDGSPLNRRLRRWRVLASFLSAFSAGLGYLWCVLDQDGLCWHDRITGTHVQLTPPTE